MQWTVLEKLKKDNGESLAEVLIAILISAAGMLLLSSLIFAASHMIEKGDANLSSLYEGANAMEEKSAAPAKGTQLVIKSGNHQEELNIDIYIDEESGLASYESHGGEGS